MLCLSLFQQKLQINPIVDLSLDILIRQIDGCCYWLCLWRHQLAFRAQFHDAKRPIAFDKLAKLDQTKKTNLLSQILPFTITYSSILLFHMRTILCIYRQSSVKTPPKNFKLNYLTFLLIISVKLDSR